MKRFAAFGMHFLQLPQGGLESAQFMGVVRVALALKKRLRRSGYFLS